MVSYTFWSQCVTAEVYALHMVLVLGSLYALFQVGAPADDGAAGRVLRWYALGFGNHLSMILLAPGIVVFLFLAEPRGWRAASVASRRSRSPSALRPLGASQYLWNLRTLWLLPDPPTSDRWSTRSGTFWFDVTKSDWRDTMVLNVPQSMLADHARCTGSTSASSLARPSSPSSRLDC